MKTRILGENISNFLIGGGGFAPLPHPLFYVRKIIYPILYRILNFFEISCLIQKLLIRDFKVFQRYFLSTSYKWGQNVKMT